MERMLARSKLRELRRILRAGFDLIIPPICMGCGERGAVWCSACDERLVPPSGARCFRCGLPRMFQTCPACSPRSMGLHVESLAAYRPPLSTALVAFKYRPERTFAEVLASWCQEKIDGRGWSPSVLLPVPLSKVRFRERGYNQVELITSTLARFTSIPYSNSILKRVRDTRSQVGLNPAARFENMVQAFDVSPSPLGVDSVLLVDDLLTSGATILACTHALLKAGVQRVFALTIARA